MAGPGDRAADGTPAATKAVDPARLHPSVSLHWRQWEGDWVVFDEASGGTHRLDRLSAFVLSALEAGPVAPSHLVDELVEATNDSRGSVQASIERVLRDLADHGLIDSRR